MTRKTVVLSIIAAAISACATTPAPTSSPLITAPAPVTFDGNVAGQATDFVFMLVPDANPATPGFAMRAGDSLRLVLPQAFKRNSQVAINADADLNLVPTKGWAQGAVRLVGQYRVGYSETSNAIMVRALQDIGVDGANASGIKVIHLRGLSDLDVAVLKPIFEQEDLAEVHRVKLKLEFAHTETEVSQVDIGAGELPPPQQLLGSITNTVIDRAKLPNRFAELYPAVRDYVATRCFGQVVDLESDPIRSHLSRIEIQEGIAKYLARKIAELTIDHRAIEFDRADYKLSETKPFSWRRNLPPPLVAKKTIFNYVATYNAFERRFAEFLDNKATDVLRFAALGTTEQGESGTQFRVDYLKPSGAIGFYHPDWVVVQKTKAGEVNWIIETKGRVWEGTGAKDEAIRDWCERIAEATGTAWRYVRVNQVDFDSGKPTAISDL